MMFTQEDWDTRIIPYLVTQKSCWVWTRSDRLKVAFGKQKFSIREIALQVFRQETINTSTRMSCRNTKCVNPEHILNSMEERFWNNVIRPEHDESCWLWTGSTVGGGYGCFGRKTTRAHRYSYTLHKGPIPPGLLIRHKCNNPPCVNPDHLIPGTYLDNNNDMYQSNRQVILRGEQSGMSKLTEPEVIKIRILDAKGIDHYTIAAQFKVSRPTIDCIVNRKTWSHVE